MVMLTVTAASAADPSRPTQYMSSTWVTFCIPVSRIIGRARYQMFRCRLPLVRSRPQRPLAFALSDRRAIRRLPSSGVKGQVLGHVRRPQSVLVAAGVHDKLVGDVPFVQRLV